MSRFSSLFDALSDKKARFLAEKQIVNDLIFDFYFNSLGGKNNFDAVVISGGPSGNSATTAQLAQDDLIAIKVRPLDIQDLALPDPCSETCKGKGESYISYLYALHPTAYSAPNVAEESGTVPAFGSIVECYFEDRKRFRQLRWRRKDGAIQGNHKFACQDLQKLVGNFTGANLISDVRVEQIEGTYNGSKTEFKGKTIKNGEVPLELLRTTKNAKNNKLLLIDAADDFDKLAIAFQKHFGEKISLSSGYRNLQDQITTKQRKIDEDKSSQAATPGKSKHGFGIAIDINTTYNGATRFKSEIYKWMRENAPEYNWEHPLWAHDGHDYPSGDVKKDGAGKPVKQSKNDEAWHWEYTKPGILTT